MLLITYWHTFKSFPYRQRARVSELKSISSKLLIWITRTACRRDPAWRWPCFFFCWCIWGACPPPPYQKAGYATAPTAHPYRGDYFFFLFLTCLSACSTGKWGPFSGEDFFFFLGGGGLSAQNVSAPRRKPKAPQCPPTQKKILATPLVCVCVCVCALVWTDIWGHFCVFNHISADTRGVGTSPVVRPMPINVLSIFKHIYIVNVIFLIRPHTVVKMKVCV